MKRSAPAGSRARLVVKRYVTVLFSVLSAVVFFGFSASPNPGPPASENLPTVSGAHAPAGAESLPVQWFDVAAPGLGVMLTAVARPLGSGPFPAIILFHGSHGFAREYVELAASLAGKGVVAVAPCWFSGGGGAGSRFVTSIPCSESVPIAEVGPKAVEIVRAHLQAAQSLTGVQPGWIGLWGHSRGASASMNYVLTSGALPFLVLDSGVYPRQILGRVREINVPVLMIHGFLDSPADGGAASTNVQMARDFEAAMRREGKQVQAKYYEAGGHNSIFTSRAQYDDEVEKIVDFVRLHTSK